jgi:CDP-glycerol glycerophosphotransferase (TagB/SpsB family)
MSEEVYSLLARLSALGRSMPKQRNRIVFPGRVSGRLVDNVKYAFLHFARNEPEFDCYFLTMHRDEHSLLKRHGLPSLLFGQQESIEILATANIVICDDFSWKNGGPAYPLLAKARTVQLWHGVPLKAIGFPEIATTPNITPERANFLRNGYSGYDAVVSTSPFCTEYAFSKAFAASDFPELGYPRNDALLCPPSADFMLNADAALYGDLLRFRKTGGRVIFYMPTFRDEGYDPFSCGAVDLSALSRLAERHNAMVVLKLHPYLEFSAATLPERVCVAHSKSDVYPLLPQCDILLTDYSSIYFDFLLLDRPQLFYPFDYQRYITRNRALLFDYETMTPGPKASEPRSLERMLDTALEGEDSYNPARDALRKSIFTHHDAHSAARLAAYVRQRFLM